MGVSLFPYTYFISHPHSERHSAAGFEGASRLLRLNFSRLALLRALRVLLTLRFPPRLLSQVVFANRGNRNWITLSIFWSPGHEPCGGS